METITKQEGFAAEKLFVLPQLLLEDISGHPLIRNLYITDMGYFPRAQFHFRERREGCASHILIYCTDGCGWFAADGQKRTLVQKGSVFVLPANQAHSYGADGGDPWSIYWVHYQGDYASFYLDEFPPNSVHRITPEKFHRIEGMFHEGFSVLEKGYFLTNIIYVSQILAQLLSFMFIFKGQQHISSQNQHVTMDRVIQIMIDHLDKTLSLQELSKQINLSKPHLSQLFKKHTGYSPIDYFLRLKIQRACQYLDLTDESLKEISAKLGFTDPYYFSRLFSKIMGIPPSRYKKKEKG
jgi:AraC-like DNA-binding protein